ncbi:MAG: carotenoid oxygenase family protein [Myxococcota bacterium]
MSQPMPKHPFLSGVWEPWPMEGEVQNLPVTGEIPRELHGALYRNGPNPQFAPRGGYHPFSGDGMIHGFFVSNGRVDYRNRWVRTPRFDAERAAGEALWSSFMGSSAAPDPRTEGVPGGPANTNIVWHSGKLLALVEGGLPPVELDPRTLHTICTTDYSGSLRDGTFTAHPKLDPETGQMLGFRYSVMEPYVVYYEISADGRVTREVPIHAPWPSMVHDFITTREHVIFPIFPATLRIERASRGESVLGWEPELGTMIGVMPRSGGTADVTWLSAEPSFVFHPMNAYTEGRRIVADVARYKQLPIPAAGLRMEIGGTDASLWRWEIDLDARKLIETQRDDRACEFPRLDERRTGLPYRVGFAGGEGGLGGGFTSILRYDVASGKRVVHDFGAGSAVSEPIFVPLGEDAPEGHGFVLTVVYRAETGRSDLAILDAENLDRAPLALAHLPHRVPGGFHGNWRPGA